MQRPLPVKMRKPLISRRRQRARIAGDPLVEARRRRHQRALVGRDRLGDVARRDPRVLAGTLARRRARSCRGARSGRPHSRAMSPSRRGARRESGSGSRGSRRGRPRTAAGSRPRSTASACGVRGGRPVTPLPVRLAVGEGELGIVAGGAGDGAGGGKLRVLEDALAERDLRRRRRIAGRVRDEGRAARTAPSARRAGRLLLRARRRSAIGQSASAAITTNPAADSQVAKAAHAVDATAAALSP